MIYLGLALSFILTSMLLYRHGNETLVSEYRVSRLSFFSILFTTGLDGGLIFLPLTDFVRYSDSNQFPELNFASPLVIEFGFWGILSWLCYFVTICYFALYESRLKVFERPLIKLINNALILLTCAFTAWLLYSNLAHYIPILKPEPWLLNAIVLLVISLAVISSARIYFIKVVSVVSVILFFLLMVLIGWQEQLSIIKFSDYLVQLSQYFFLLDKFTFPQNDYHEFYLYWWFAWSIMIGQFTAQFVQGIKVHSLLIAILFLPSVPIAIWFILLYDFHLLGLNFSSTVSWIFIIMGALFVINSMDSLIRLYSTNLNLGEKKLGCVGYHFSHITLLFVIALMFDIQVLNIELVGAIVIALWLVTLIMGLKKLGLKAIIYSDKTDATEQINK